MKRKILLAGNSELVVFKFRRELIERLIQEEFDVYASFPITEFGNGADTAKELHCTFIETPMAGHGTNPLEDFRLIGQYKRILKTVNPDVLLTYTIKPNIYASLAAKSCHVPSIINISGLGVALERPGPLRYITTSMYRLSTRANQRVFFQNKENEAFFASRHIADGKRDILPGSGVNLKMFPLLPYPTGNDIHFLFMARIRKEKGIDQYLDAAKVIHAKYPNTVFHVLGVCEDERYNPILRELTAQGIIKYEGHQRDVRPFQKISSCTVHPTYYPEGLSNVLLESAASGRPIITTDRSGCREIIKDNLNGFICKQKDSADLIKQIEKFIVLSWEERRNMGLAGHRKIATEFNRDKVIQKYMDEIVQVEKTCKHE